jgi:hypothetical protein
MLDDEYRQLREIYQRKQAAEAPLPWKRVPIYIGGVTAVGFGTDTEHLLVLTHSGFGVVDCTTGVTLARKHEKESGLEDPHPIRATGIGPLEGQIVSLAGLWGGGLRTMTSDGWVVHRATPNWPAECAVLCPPEAPELEDTDTSTVLVKDVLSPIRAFGFSDSGRSMVVTDTSLHVWMRHTLSGE